MSPIGCLLISNFQDHFFTTIFFRISGLKVYLRIKSWLTSKTLRVRDSAGLFELLREKKRRSKAFPSLSSNTICSLSPAASAAAAAASRSFRASSIKLCRLPTNFWDCQRPHISIHLKDSSRPEIIIIGYSPAYLLDIWWRWFTSPKSHKNFNAVYVNLPYSSDLIICLWADDTATYRLLYIAFFDHRVMLCVNLNGESIYAQQNSDL